MRDYGAYYRNNQRAFVGESAKYGDGRITRIRKSVLLRYDRLCKYELRAMHGKNELRRETP